MNRPRVWAEIDLSAISHNVNVLRSRLRPDTRFMLVIKADAYGLGAVPIARFAESLGVDAFGVGDSSEALELRQAGIVSPILVLGTIVPGEAAQVVANDVSVCIHSRDRIRLLEAEAHRQGRRVKVHLMVDTGMGRLGVSPEKALEMAAAVRESHHLELEGAATHIAGTCAADLDEDRDQLRRFRWVRAALPAAGFHGLVYHAANSRAILKGLGTDLDMVRPGLAVYGTDPDPDGETRSLLRPVLSLRTQLSFLKDVEAGTAISYGRLYRTSRLSRIATLPVGYSDGLPRRLSNKGRALVRGLEAPIVGAVTMDYTMIDISYIPGACVGDTVTLIGRDGEAAISVADVARAADALPYEVTCGLGRRVRRFYLPVLSECLQPART
ncbi:MAG: alanine racemase [Planctomycetota bacterium]